MKKIIGLIFLFALIPLLILAQAGFNVTSQPASNITQTSATLNASLSGIDDFYVDTWFVWGQSPGDLSNATPNFGKLTSGSFSAQINGLQPGTTYYYQGVTRKGNITVYGLPLINFTTQGNSTPPPTPPTPPVPPTPEDSNIGNLVEGKDFATGEILVKFYPSQIDLRQDYGNERTYSFGADNNLDLKEAIKESNIAVYRTRQNETVKSAIRRLGHSYGTEYVEPNYIRRAAVVPNDPDFINLWGLQNSGQSVFGYRGQAGADINAVQAWDIYSGSKAIKVAVIDTGIDYNHSDLRENMWDGANCRDENNKQASCPFHGWDFVNRDNNPMDDYSHGTHIAGTIGAKGNNGIGIAGINWNVSLVALKAGNSNNQFYISDIVKAINFATFNNIKIINASFSSSGSSESEKAAIAKFRDAGGLFVAAAGNRGLNVESNPAYPCSYSLDNIICVAATDYFDRKASFSNYGSVSVDVGAPGDNIYSTLPGSYGIKDGTSMAAPHVAGLAALVWGYKPNLSYDQVKRYILDNGDSLSGLEGRTVTGKRINAYKTLKALGGVQPPQEKKRYLFCEPSVKTCLGTGNLYASSLECQNAIGKKCFPNTDQDADICSRECNPTTPEQKTCYRKMWIYLTYNSQVGSSFWIKGFNPLNPNAATGFSNLPEAKNIVDILWQVGFTYNQCSENQAQPQPPGQSQQLWECYKGAKIYTSLNGKLGKSVWSQGVGSSDAYAQQGYETVAQVKGYVDLLSEFGYQYSQCQ